MSQKTFNFNFLMPLKGVATKTFSLEADGWELKKNYKAGKYFKGFEVPVANLEEAYEVLKENQNHSVFNIHGGFIEGIDKSNMVRRKRADHEDGEKPTLVDRMLSLFCLDIDGYEGGDIDHFIQWELPPEFQHADYIYQFSSSYGLTSQSLKCHLFFWLQEPVHNLDIRGWIKAYNKEKGWGNIIDPSVLNCAQPIYIQKRIIEQGDDPIKDFLGYIPKDGPLDFKPASLELQPHKSGKKADKYDITAGIEKILTSENYHEELRSLALSLINRKVPPGTVKALLEGAMNAARRGQPDEKRWQDRFDDIGRAVTSAVEIVGAVTVEDVLLWVDSAPRREVQADFAQKVLHLSALEKEVVIPELVKKLGFGIQPIKKTIKLAEEADLEERAKAAKEAQTAERLSRGIYELELAPSNSGIVSKKAGTILAKSEKEPTVFQMGGSLVSVGIGVPNTIRQCSKLAELGKDYPPIPVIQRYKKPYYDLAARLGTDAVFINEKGNEVECPMKISYLVGDANNNDFKSLTGIIEHPFINSNWKLVQENGYNETTGLYTMLHRKLKVKKMDADDAFRFIIDEVFAEFPFKTDLDQVAAVAALMTAIQRPTIAGDEGMPGFGIVSPVQSSGKTALAQLISYSIYNRPVAASSWSDDEEEMGKHILAILQEGHSCVLFDNIRQGSTVQSGRLAMAMSNDVFGGRILGENRTTQVPSSVMWLFTGNGIQFIGDFATRVYPITINPKMENPHTRTFKRENIGQWTMDNRKKIISALLSIIIDGKGMEEIGGSTRFKLWDQFVRRPLFKVSGLDVNDVIINNQKSDPRVLSRQDLIHQLHKIFGEKKFTTREMLSKAFGSFETDVTPLGDSLVDILDKRAKNSMSLGRIMLGMTDAVYGNLTLTKHNSNVVYWQVKEIEDGS